MVIWFTSSPFSSYISYNRQYLNAISLTLKPSFDFQWMNYLRNDRENLKNASIMTENDKQLNTYSMRKYYFNLNLNLPFLSCKIKWHKIIHEWKESVQYENSFHYWWDNDIPTTNIFHFIKRFFWEIIGFLFYVYFVAQLIFGGRSFHMNY